MDTNRGYAYTFWLAALLFINYYMAYMVCLFLILFFAWYALTSFTDVKKLGKQVGLFVHRSLLAAGLAAFLLIPTFISLKASKGQYTTQTIHFKWEYFPPKMLTKLVLGAFDFKQMPSGYPNIFVGSLVLFAFLLFFFNRRFKLSSRLAALALTGFLLVSMCFEPLDLMWHGFQFPVWYPYRFSFLLSFWMVFLAAQAYCVTLIKNLCYDVLRRSQPDEDGRPPEELNLPTDTNIAREVEQRDEVNQVRRLIGRLPEQQKRVILLRDVNDCSFEEIEQATGLNAINIRVLLSRARKKIREQYNAIMNYESK